MRSLMLLFITVQQHAFEVGQIFVDQTQRFLDIKATRSARIGALERVHCKIGDRICNLLSRQPALLVEPPGGPAAHAYQAQCGDLRVHHPKMPRLYAAMNDAVEVDKYPPARGFGGVTMLGGEIRLIAIHDAKFDRPRQDEVGMLADQVMQGGYRVQGVARADIARKAFGKNGDVFRQCLEDVFFFLEVIVDSRTGET